MLRQSLLLAAAAAVPVAAQTQRPMTFLDAQNMRQASGQDLSPDGRQMLYALSTPDWQNARRQSDIYLVSVDRGLASTRQLTFTKDKNESNAKWSRDGSFIAFLSDRDASSGNGAAAGGGRGGAGGGRNQLFVLRLDGGEAKRVTDARDGVANFQFTKDGKSIVYTSGRAGDQVI
jgi:Tol biopolymer transport system component